MMSDMLRSACLCVFAITAWLALSEFHTSHGGGAAAQVSTSRPECARERDLKVPWERVGVSHSAFCMHARTVFLLPRKLSGKRCFVLVPFLNHDRFLPPRQARGLCLGVCVTGIRPESRLLITRGGGCRLTVRVTCAVRGAESRTERNAVHVRTVSAHLATPLS